MRSSRSCEEPRLSQDLGLSHTSDSRRATNLSLAFFNPCATARNERSVLLQTRDEKNRETRTANAILVPGMYFYANKVTRSVIQYSQSTLQRATHLGVLYQIERATKSQPIANHPKSLRAPLTEVLEHGLLAPSNTLVNVGGGVRETLGLTGLSAKDTVEVRSDLGVQRVLTSACWWAVGGQTLVGSPCWVHRLRGCGTEHIGS